MAQLVIAHVDELVQAIVGRVNEVFGGEEGAWVEQSSEAHRDVRLHLACGCGDVCISAG